MILHLLAISVSLPNKMSTNAVSNDKNSYRFQNTLNKTTKVRSFKSRENILKKEDGSDWTGSNNKFSSVTLHELAMKARESIS